MEIDEVAGRVSAVADEVSGAASRLGLAQPGPAGFAGDGPGRLGELGRDLHGVWSAALAAREREAAGHGARLTDLAGALRQAAAGYRQVEDDAQRRHGTVG
jgi:Excreted virulence factor EspC, type VII ESX diderm